MEWVTRALMHAEVKTKNWRKELVISWKAFPLSKLDAFL